MEGLFRLTLLGSGMPVPDPRRFGPCTLIEAGGRRILIDAGRGATMRLFQLGVPIGSIDLLLLTHFHSDHTVGIPDVWLTGWLGGKFGRRSRPMHVTGPSGTQHMMAHIQQAYTSDVSIRIADEGLPAEGAIVVARDHNSDELVFDDGSLRIRAFEVDHGQLVKPACGYRIDFDGRSAVVSGDTRYDENLIRNSAHVDLLVHEVAMTWPALMQSDRIARIIGHHSTPREAGRVFFKTRPRLAVFNHVVLLGDEKTPAPTEEDLIAETRTEYDGPLKIGCDMMACDIGLAGVEVRTIG